MTIKIYALYDVVSKSMAPPIFARNDAEALRSVCRSFDNAYKNIGSFNHADFNLYELGYYDDELPEIHSLGSSHVVSFDYTPPKEVPNGPQRIQN